jgi:hypothetical protein
VPTQEHLYVQAGILRRRVSYTGLLSERAFMPRFLKPCLAVLTLALLCGYAGDAQTASKPLTKGQLLALVAGNALSENVVHHLGAEGMGFRPSAEYRSLLLGAAADAAVLEAYDKAKVSAAADSEEP